MPEPLDAGHALLRRKFIAAGGTIAAAGTFGGLIDPLEALGATRWPKGRLGARVLGHTNEIAEQLYLSVRTVETHRAHIQQKLGLSTRAELVRYAPDNDLIDR